MYIAGIVNNSFVDGKGIRFTVFTQGCKHRCKGCHNEETHKFNCGTKIDTEELKKRYLENKKYTSGITLSGGDPFEQSEECYKFIESIKNELDGNVWCYTGYTFEELMGKRDYKHKLLESVDVLVDGRFELDKRTLDASFKGSSNQRIIDVKESIKEGKVVELKC